MLSRNDLACVPVTCTCSDVRDTRHMVRPPEVRRIFVSVRKMVFNPFPLKPTKTAWMLKMSSVKIFCLIFSLFVNSLYEICMENYENHMSQINRFPWRALGA